MQDHRDGECREKNWKLSDGVVDRSVERGRRRGVVFTGKEGEKRRRKKRGKKWREIARNWEEMVYRKGMREGKGGVLRAGIVLIAGFSAVMLGMMSYSFIYLQRDKSACIVPAMYPSYMRLIEFDKRYTKHADKYNLYLYREKKLGNLHDLYGIPVLFIPGNAGSYKQVRSIASEAANQYSMLQLDPVLSKQYRKNLDFFAVDFNNDFTAFHGQTLLDQVDYSNEAVKYILSLYKKVKKVENVSSEPYIPNSVIVIGHSMGGIVVRVMMTMPNYLSGSINTIITLSTPHLLPPILFDRKMKDIYDSVNKFWSYSYFYKNESNPLNSVSLVSITGGNLDIMVSSDYCDVSSLVPKSHGFTVFSSSIPMVWTGMDHQAILWCDQLRKVIVKSLFDIIDSKSVNQTKPLSSRIRIFKKYYLMSIEDSVENKFLKASLISPFLRRKAVYDIFPSKSRYVLKSFEAKSSGCQRIYFLPISPRNIFNFTTFSLFTDQRVTGTDKDQIKIFLCKLHPSFMTKNSDFRFYQNLTKSDLKMLKCKDSKDDLIRLPSQSNIKKIQTYFFTYLEYTNSQLDDYQFIAVVDRINKNRKGFLIAEFFNKNVIQVQSKIRPIKFSWNAFRVTLGANRPLVSDINIPGIDNSLFAYKLKMNYFGCDHSFFPPVIKQYISSPYESKYFVNMTKIDVNFHGTAPFLPPIMENGVKRGLTIRFWLDPTCTKPVDISVSLDFYGSLGKLAIKFWTALIIFTYVITLLSLRKQFKIYNNYGVFINFNKALEFFMRDTFLSLSIIASFLFVFLSLFQFPKTIDMDDLFNPKLREKLWVKDTWKLWNNNNIFFGYRDSFFWFLGPLFITISLGFAFIFAQVTYFIVSFAAIGYNLLRKHYIKLINRRRFLYSFCFSGLKLKQRIIAIILLLFLVAIMVPYQLAYLFACVIQFFTCVKALISTQKRDFEKAFYYQNFYNYVHSILILMLLLLPINVPILIVWLRKMSINWLLPFSSHHNIFSILPILILVEFLANKKMIMQAESGAGKVLDVLFLVFSVFLTIYGLYYTYFVHHLINFLSFFLIIFHLTPSLPSFRYFIDDFFTKQKTSFYC
ncbi:uncharacterized protein T551_01519 [Pneumocystis jirovecii RU7]|uniref:GPI inositol-deacylase n=1 Tax=Pneumocystis jirovecii (strain RU7) TaxID=1408657 RepID=A0A0W4ZRF3_PNEJ7|nr:uncharacterized protein T551_01519 [Pneumocystis jirovecii RU7]KTW30967.1 hypothetical protein T551_01519 [Pneumocystis jirovecii RU7]